MASLLGRLGGWCARHGRIVRQHVGGEVAGMTDAGDRIAERTPAVIGVVVLLSALLLLLAFRAPLVAIKAERAVPAVGARGLDEPPR
jgi:hypothetical protein